MRLKVSLSVLEVFGFQKSFGFWRLGSCLFFFLLGVTRFPLLGCGTRWAVYFVPFKIKLAAATIFFFFCLYSQKMNYGFGSNTQISRFGCSFGAACFGDFNVWASCDSWFPTIRAQSSGMFQCHAQENFKNSRSNHNFQQITSRISRLISRFQEYPESLQDLRETSKFDARISRTRYQYFPR